MASAAMPKLRKANRRMCFSNASCAIKQDLANSLQRYMPYMAAAIPTGPPYCPTTCIVFKSSDMLSPNQGVSVRHKDTWFFNFIFAYYSPMPIVKMFFQETMFHYSVCFLQGNTLIGTHWEFPDLEKVIGLMESANCRFRDIQLVRQTLKERRPGSIDIELSQEQFDRLRHRKQRV
jgi:hypothetical protein